MESQWFNNVELQWFDSAEGQWVTFEVIDLPTPVLRVHDVLPEFRISQIEFQNKRNIDQNKRNNSYTPNYSKWVLFVPDAKPRKKVY